jgi:hypothetical protein
LLLCSSNLALGVLNWTVIYIITTTPSKDFSGDVAGDEEEEEAPTSTMRQQNINK